MSTDRCWLAIVDDAPVDADAVAPLRELDGAPAGMLAAWLRSAKPLRGARRADPRIVDPRGADALVSLVWPPRDALVAFDDVAVQGARRALLGDALAPVLATTLLVDDSHFAGSLVARRGDDAARLLRDDPFARVWPARILRVGPGLLGAAALPAGPGIERHGSATPWPGGRF